MIKVSPPPPLLRAFPSIFHQIHTFFLISLKLNMQLNCHDKNTKNRKAQNKQTEKYAEAQMFLTKKFPYKPKPEPIV